ncbi:MFS transporter [Nodosilinea nodulosa]|uniref:MFS transporter n=1 Tax=Nodosilinea nodulosa TaxID=416001 RepID=UPI0005945DCE|nr:MFS transporter [Nodosilinea nodulosa]
MTSSKLPETRKPEAAAKWWVMLGIGLGVLMFTLDTSIVNVALPTLVKVFDTQFSTVQWVVLSYLLVINALVLGAARWGDMIGKKPLYLGGLAVFTISSALCGLSPSVGWLIAFRAMQGAGAVMISALGAAIITEVFPRSERGRALGIIGAVVSLGIALGPTVGGLLLDWSGWRTIFWVNLPVGIFASLVVARSLPNVSLPSARQGFDWWGALLLTLVLVAFSLGMTEGQDVGFNQALPLGLLAVALAGLVGFLWLENRLANPLLDLSLFRNRPFSLSLLTAVLVFVVIAGVIFILPFYLELVLDYRPRHVGLLLAVSPVLAGFVAPLSGYLSDRLGSRLISLAGLACMTLGCWLISTFTTDLTDAGYILRVAPFGIGLGLFQSPNNSAIMGAAPPERLGIASGLLSLSRTLGQTTGLSLMATVFALVTLAYGTNVTEVTQASAEAIVTGVMWTFRLAALVLIVAAVLLARVWRIE